MASSTRQMVKEIILIVALNIFLPTLDVYSDLALIIKFLANRPKPHYAWATILIVPFILNYTFSWILWWRLDKNKWISWVAVILGCYPQWYAANVIRVLWSDFETGLAKKKKMDREVSEYEVFLESVFTVLGMTYIFVKADHSSDRKLVIGKRGSTEEVLFFLTYTTSILTASLGLAKCLKIGPCRVLGEGGALGGLCSGRFLLLMFTVAATLIGKGSVLPLATSFIQYRGPGVYDGSIIEVVVVVVCTMFLPGLLLALMSLCHYKESFKTMLSHPSLLLMPVFTHFTFTTNKTFCTREEDGGHNDTRISFSRKWTLINVAVSVIGHVCFGVVINMMQDYCIQRDAQGQFCVPRKCLSFCLPIAVVGILSTLLFLSLDQCCHCCSCSCTPDIQKAVLRVNDPLTEYVVDNETKEIITFVDWTTKRNETNEQEMVNGE